jgi:hypothetical protein
VLYHAVAFILYLVAGIILLVEIKDHDRQGYYKAYLAAAVSMQFDHHSHFVLCFFSYSRTANIQNTPTDLCHGAESFLRI